jgi:hypothetical protein
MAAGAGYLRAMTEHGDKADEVERELDDMKDDSERLGDHIETAREDWERRKADPAVPGAGGDPQAAEGGIPPEADEPTD